jgi:anaphase-promoting complex subunit 5
MKKAIIAKLRGDEQLAEEWAQNHNRVWEEGMRRIADSDIRR